MNQEDRRQFFLKYKKEWMPITPNLSYDSMNALLKHIENINTRGTPYKIEHGKPATLKSFIKIQPKDETGQYKYIDVINDGSNGQPPEIYINTHGVQAIEEAYNELHQTLIPTNTNIIEKKIINAEIIEYEDANPDDKHKIHHINNHNEEKNEEHKYIKIKDHFNMNLVYDIFEQYEDIKFIFNEKIPYNKSLNTTQNTVQHTEIDVINSKPKKIEQFIIRKSAICPRCNQKVYITTRQKIGLQNVICRNQFQANECRNTITLRDFDKKMEIEIEKQLFIYDANYYTENIKTGTKTTYSTSPFEIKSFTQLRGRKNIVNILRHNGENYVLARDYSDDKPLFTYDELRKQKVPENLPNTNLFKILYKIKNIVKKKYELQILNKGEQLQTHLLLSSISRLILDWKNHHIIVIGDAGVAKTGPVQLLSSILFNNTEIGSGGKATVAGMIANLQEKPPKPGQLATQDLMVYDEATRAFQINPVTKDYFSDLMPTLKNCMLNEKVERHGTGVGYEGIRTATVVLLGNFDQTHLTELREDIKKHYFSIRKRLAKQDPKYELPQYNYDEGWPLIVRNTDYFRNIINNPMIADAHDQARRKYHGEKRELATGLEYPSLYRFLVFFTVEGFIDVTDDDFGEYEYDEDFNKKLTNLNYDKLYYQFAATINNLFPKIKLSDQTKKEMESYLNDFFERYPNISKIGGKVLDKREKDLYISAMHTIMCIEKTTEINESVKDTFEMCFKNNNTILSTDMYNMEENKDTIIQNHYIELLTITSEQSNNGDTIKEIIQDDRLYNRVMEELIKTKRIEASGTGYAITDKGRLYLQELIDKKEKKKQVIKKDVEPVKENVFLEMEK